MEDYTVGSALSDDNDDSMISAEGAQTVNKCQEAAIIYGVYVSVDKACWYYITWRHHHSFTYLSLSSYQQAPHHSDTTFLVSVVLELFVRPVRLDGFII